MFQASTYRSARVLLLLFILSLLPSCMDEYHYTHGNISGKISDATTGAVIGHCTIAVVNSDGDIEDKQATDSNGEYKTKDLNPGTYTISIEKKDYWEGASLTVQVRNEETTRCDIALQRIPATITADPHLLDYGSNASMTLLRIGIVNDYPEPLDWFVGEYSCQWISSVVPDHGTLAHGETATIRVTIDRSKLSSGENKATIVISSKNGQGVSIALTAIGEDREAPVLNVTGVSNIGMNSATLAGEMVSAGKPAYTHRGFTCSLRSMDSDAEELTAETNDDPKFSYVLTNLTPGRKYYVRAYAVNSSAGKVWSANEVSFTTTESYCVVRTDNVTNLDLSAGSCQLNGRMEAIGNPAYSEKGFCINETGEPGVSDTKYAVPGSGSGAFSYSLSGLAKEKTYYVRAYALQNREVFYGETVQLSTSTVQAEVATNGATSVTHKSAILNGSVLNEGSPKYTEHGFCYSVTRSTPDLTDIRLSVSSSSGKDFSYSLTGLERNKTYWYRAYLIQDGKTIYGQVASFETTWAGTVVLTAAASNITYHEMTLNGNINAVGSPAFTKKGFCYSFYSSDPTLTNATVETVPGNTAGPFSCKLKNLLAQTRYYFRAYAIQDGEPTYGEVMYADTYSPPQVLTLYSSAHADAGMMNLSWTVELYGGYGFIGDPACTEFGFVYGPGDSPTVENVYGYTAVKADVTSDGIYSVTLKEMPGNAKYYFRAYGKSSLGYTYGDVMSFSTQP